MCHSLVLFCLFSIWFLAWLPIIGLCVSWFVLSIHIIIADTVTFYRFSMSKLYFLYRFRLLFLVQLLIIGGPSWSWSHGGRIYNYICNQYMLPLTLWVRIPLRRGAFDATLCDKVCQCLAVGRWFSPPEIKLSAMIWLKYCWKYR